MRLARGLQIDQTIQHGRIAGALTDQRSLPVEQQPLDVPEACLDVLQAGAVAVGVDANEQTHQLALACSVSSTTEGSRLPKSRPSNVMRPLPGLRYTRLVSSVR